MAWTLLPLVLLAVIIVGVRVIRGKRTPSTPEVDFARIEKWKSAQQRGFLVFCLRSTFPFVMGYCLLGPIATSWKQTGYLSYPIDQISFFVLLGVVFTLISGFLACHALRSSAEEAKARQSQI